jgi:hypothetical protein
MRTDEFWAVIEKATADLPDPSSGGAGRTPAAVAKRAVAELASRDAEEIVAWGRHLDKVMAASCKEDLWAAAYLINGGCSDEGFDDFRGWLIAHGRDVVARAVRVPDSLADLPAVRAAADSGADFDGAQVLGIAATAYREATGESLPPLAEPIVRPSSDTFWDFDNEDEMHRRLPRLSALFLEPPQE